MLNVGSCFSGIGGIELGLEATGGFQTRWQIEIDPYASAVLAKHWPNAKRYSDIKTISPAQLERVDVICGGYPCQPFSFAGKRGGDTDPRDLWPDMLRIIRDLRPRFALLENVPGHLSMGFGRVLGDLAECGYDAEWQVLSAAGVGAPHLRRRIFIIAHATGANDRILKTREMRGQISESRSCSISPDMADTISEGCTTGNSGAGGNRTSKGQETFQEPSGRHSHSCSAPTRSDWWSVEPNVGRVAHGVPSRPHRLKCLGNAVVPQVAQRVGEMILGAIR